MPSEISASFLFSQLENSINITANKLTLWNKYESFFSNEFPQFKNELILKDCLHNAHIYNINLISIKQRSDVMLKLKKLSINTTFHYLPLHSTKPGLKFGKTVGKMNITDEVAETILRLPIYPNLNIDYVISALREVLNSL